MRRLTILSVACGLALLFDTPAHAQLNGSHALGDYGVQSGTQPAPGILSGFLYIGYNTDEIRNAEGDRVGPNPGDPTSLGSHAPKSSRSTAASASRTRAAES